MNEPNQMHEQTIDDLILVKEYGKCPGDELAWRGLHVEMGSFTDLADWLDSFVESGACGYAYQGDAFSDSTNSMATWVSCLADKIRRMARLQNAEALRGRRQEMKNVESSMDWMSFSNKMKQAACQLSSSACPMVLVLPDGREVRFTDINVDTFDCKGKRGDTEYTSIGFKVNLLGAEVRNGKDDDSLASPPCGNGAKMREALEPKTDTEWEAICARCREGESPKECQYYGDPDGCSADGLYPMTQIGNGAKMREVVELLARVILPPQEEYPAWYGGGKVPDHDGWLAWIRQAQSYAKSALAAPPRNCDVGSAEEQDRRFKEYCDSNYNLNDKEKCQICPLFKHRTICEFAWAQMPYENNEKKEALPPCACGGAAATVERGTEPEGFAIMCSRCFRKTALHPSLALAEEEWRTMLSHNTTTKEMKGGAE